MDVFCVKNVVNIESFLFDILPLKSTMMMADVLNVNPLLFRPSFGKDALNFQNPFWQSRDINSVWNVRQPCETKPPPNELMPCFLLDEEKTV